MRPVSKRSPIGVVAIIITIMVLEIRVPHGSDLAALQAGLPVLSAYVLSYVNVGIFWNNHHHMLHVTERVNGKVLWPTWRCCSGCRWYRFVIRWIDEMGFHRPADGRLWCGVAVRCGELSDTATAAHRL